MNVQQLDISIVLENGQEVELTIYEERPSTLFLIDEIEAIENGESRYQLIEGCSYEYILAEGFRFEKTETVTQSKIKNNTGRINPNVYVGTLTLNIYRESSDKRAGIISIEVRSIKTSYRDDYRKMLEYIAEKCTDLLMQQSSCINQNYTANPNKDPKSIYQRFAFVKSIIESDSFNDAILRIQTSPVKRWRETVLSKSVLGIKQFRRKSIRQIAGGSKRINVPPGSRLRERIESIPSQIETTSKEETTDIPENKFIKYVLKTFLQFCNSLLINKGASQRLRKEAALCINRLEKYLSDPLFKDLSGLTNLPLNSPVLQKKEGYREVFQTWLMFDLAAKLVWTGGDNVYEAGKKDVAVLYEYWLFFTLIETIQEVFNIKPYSLASLIQSTNNGLELNIKQGKQIVISGIFESDTRSLNIEFYYNRTFSGGTEYPSSGSWTQNMRPDYTLSLWPIGINKEAAEEEEIIVHIHFDAKYKIDKAHDIFCSNDSFEEEKDHQASKNYKRDDVLKMHAYKDAIRRTAGAYIIYPGDKNEIMRGFHEILPGLGAFAISPRDKESGLSEFKAFLNDVVKHFLNRASKRERISFYTYKTYNDSDNFLREALPEPYGKNRELIPDDTFVLVAYYKNKEHLEWILNSQLYNTRIDTNRGSIRLGPQEASSRYLLLHTDKNPISDKLFSIIGKGARVFSKQKLVDKGYPTEPSQSFYLTYEVSSEIEKEFENMKWDISKLPGFRSGRNSALPFAVSLSELMRVVLK